MHPPSASDLPLSSNKLKLKLNKSLSTSSSPFYSATSLPPPTSSSPALSFHYHPTTLLSLCTHTNKPIDGPVLTALAQDLHALQREAKERALSIEATLRSMELGGEGAMEGEEWYQEAIRYLHGVDVADDWMGSEEVLGVDKLTGKKRNKKNQNKRGNAAGPTSGDTLTGEEGEGEGEEGEGEDDEGTGIKKKNMTAKEKVAALKQFWDGVDGWMAFPTTEQVEAVREVDARSVGTIGPLGPYYAKEWKEREWREEKEREREKDREREREKEKEDKKGKERKKERKERERRDVKEREKERAKDQRKLNEAQRLGLIYIDDSRLRKQILEMDKALAPILTPAHPTSSPSSQSPAPSQPTLVQRVLACFIEQHGVAQPIPHAIPPLSKKAKKKKSASHKSPPTLSLEERLRLELKAVGLLTSADATRDGAERADDELCGQLRSDMGELRQVIGGNNLVRRVMSGLGGRLVDHKQRLEMLVEAEHALHKAYKKKKMTDNAAQKAIEAFVQSQQRVGSRRRITGYIPHPKDMTGVPRVIADSVVSHPSYREVLMTDDLPPLQLAPQSFYARYPRNSALLPPSSLPPLLSHLSSPAYPPSPGGAAYYTGSPLPAFSTHNSPLGLEESGSPVRGRGVEEGEAGDSADGTGEGMEAFASPNNIGALPLTQGISEGDDNVFGF